MQFLNDKFFRVAVILFFLLLALPFMFSEPEPEKKDNTPALEFEDKNPVYNIINRIAKFYGFKREDTPQKHALNNKNLENIKKQISPQKEELNKKTENVDSLIKIEQKTNTKNKRSIHPENSREVVSNNKYYFPKTDKSGKNSEELYEILTDKEGKKYILKESTLPAPKYSLKTNNTSVNQNIAASLNTENISSHNNKQNDLKTQNAREINNNGKTAAAVYTDRNSNKRGSFSNYFKASTQIGKDFLDNIDNNIKHIRFIKQNQAEQDKTTPKYAYTKTYRTQIFNAANGKREVLSQQKPIEEDSLKNAQIIKKITADSILNKQYSDTTFKYKNGTEAAFPASKEELSLLQPRVPPHILFSDLATKTQLTQAFENSYNHALQKLPSKSIDYPMLEFVYRNQNNEVMRAPNNSFNVVAISRTLADRVSIPLDQVNIDFLDTKGRIYVVPEKALYQKYLSMKIPVIYYPDLSPENLGQAYESATIAIETLNSNKNEQIEKEQNQNKSQIEQLLKEE